MASDPHLDAVKARYGFEDWVASESEVRVRKFAADLSASPYTRARREARGDGRRHVAEHYVPEGTELSSESPVHLIVEIGGYATAAAAREALALRLARMMAPRLPDCAERGIEAGDRCFCGVDEPPSAVIFVRGNILVHIRNAGSEREPVGPLAETIDKQIMTAAGLSPSAP